VWCECRIGRIDPGAVDAGKAFQSHAQLFLGVRCVYKMDQANEKSESETGMWLRHKG
jgi:hypothetical protein